jgi:hypothetical protein
VVIEITNDFKDNNMKKYIDTFKKLQYVIFSLLALSVVLLSCNEDDDIIIDKRLMGKNTIEFMPFNPETDKPYTEEELKEAGLDVSSQAEFCAGQAVKLQLTTKIEVKKLKVFELPENTLVNEVDGGSGSEENGFTTVWSTTLEELKIAEGENKKYKFLAIFDDAGVDGFSSNSEWEEEYKIVYCKPITGSPFVSLRKSQNDVQPLKYSNAVAELAEIPGIGQTAKFNLADENKASVPYGNFDFIHQNDFSVSFWVKSDYNESEDPVLIGNQDWNSSDNVGFTYAYKKGEIRCVISDGTNSVKFWYELPKPKLNDNKWHHITGTFDRDGNWLTYINGKLEQTEDITSIGSIDSKLALGIGQDGTGNYEDWFDGSIANVVISDYVLTEQEVKGLAGGTSGVELRKADGSVAMLPVETNSGDEPVISDGVAVRTFDGNDDYATILDGGLLDFTYEKDFTIAFWMKTTSDSGDPVLIGNQNWDSSGNVGLTIAHKKGEVRSVASDGSNKADKWYEYKALLNDDQWHHVVASYDRDGNMTIYINGKKEEEKDMSAVGSIKSGQPYRLGQDGEGDYGDWFQGQMKSVIFFDYVISAEDASKLYN